MRRIGVFSCGVMMVALVGCGSGAKELPPDPNAAPKVDANKIQEEMKKSMERNQMQGATPPSSAVPSGTK